MDSNKNLWDFFNEYYFNNLGRCKGRNQLFNFHLDYLYIQQVKEITSKEDFDKYGFLINVIPDERREDMKGLLIAGFKLKEAFDTLKETYKF